MSARRSVPAILGVILAIGGLAAALRWMKTAKRPTIEPAAGAARSDEPRAKESEPPTGADPAEPATPIEPAQAAGSPKPAAAAEREFDSGESTGFLLVK